MCFIFILGLKSFSHDEYFDDCKNIYVLGETTQTYIYYKQIKYADIYFIELKLLNGQKQF